MQSILSVHRAQAVPIEPADFLTHFPDFVLQYLDDSPRHDPRRARSATTLDPAFAARRQREGCGVFFAPNAFDGRRRMEQLLQIRAVYLDLDVAKERDGLPRSTVEERKERALIDLLFTDKPPHAVIETKNGLQPIWRVRPSSDIEHDLTLFREAMRGLLLRFGGDAAAKDPTRLLRLPGYLHLKNPADPFRCGLLWNELEREPYDLAALIGAFPSPKEVIDRPVRIMPPPIDSPYDAIDLAEVIRRAAAEAGITVTFHRNADGSRQIIEDGIVTSGFISGRGNFCHSASGKPRRGGPVQLVRYYLNLSPREACRWLAARFGIHEKRDGRQAPIRTVGKRNPLACSPEHGMCPSPDATLGADSPPSAS